MFPTVAPVRSSFVTHEPTTDTSGSQAGHGTKAIVAALVANLGIAVAKLVGFLLTGSASLLAEAAHSLADTTNQGLLLLGGRQARRPEDEQHPFGYGQTRYFWSFVVALILFSLGALFAIYEGVRKIQHPHDLERPGIGVGVLLVAAVLEGLSFRTAIVESRPLKGEQSWWSFIRTAKVPELPVLLLEDSGALMGLVFALLGVGLSLATGNAVFDGIATLCIGFLLAAIASVLVVEMRSLLIGEGVSDAEKRTLRAVIEQAPHVRRFIHARTLHLGPEEVLVATKVELDPELRFSQVASCVNDIEARIREALPAARVVYVEPAVFDPSR